VVTDAAPERSATDPEGRAVIVREIVFRAQGRR
jgi:hypothetical protein